MEESYSTNQSKKSFPLVVVGAIVVAVVVVGGFALSRLPGNNSTPAADNFDAGENSTQTATTPEVEGVSDSASAEGDVQIVSVEAGSFYYKPNIIRVKVGQTVKIEMTSMDMMHDFNIDELGVKIPVTKSGSTASVEFTAQKAGEYEFYCSVGEHRQNGQVGTLIVE